MAAHGLSQLRDAGTDGQASELRALCNGRLALEDVGHGIQRLHSSSFLGLPYRIPNMNHKKEPLIMEPMVHKMPGP